MSATIIADPTKPFLRYGEVQDWLEKLGISRAASRELMTLNVIKGAPLKKHGRDYYQTSQIKEALKL